MNIRIFDLCYFPAGLLAEEAPKPLTRKEWLDNAKAVFAGYESIRKLSREEKEAACCVMECIEILFAAYFVGNEDTKLTDRAYKIYRFLRNCEEDLKRAL